MDIGGFRDMHRHRRCTQIIQPFTTLHGYETPTSGDLGPEVNILAEAGVLGEYQSAVDQAHAASARLFVQHKVTDYAAWRKVYDAFDSTRKKLGVTGQSVYRVADEPNNVVVIHDFSSLEKARAFAASPELKSGFACVPSRADPSAWSIHEASSDDGDSSSDSSASSETRRGTSARSAIPASQRVQGWLAALAQPAPIARPMPASATIEQLMNLYCMTQLYRWNGTYQRGLPNSICG